MEAGKKRLAGDAARAANTDEVKELHLHQGIGLGLALSQHGSRRLQPLYCLLEALHQHAS